MLRTRKRVEATASRGLRCIRLTSPYRTGSKDIIVGSREAHLCGCCLSGFKQ